MAKKRKQQKQSDQAMLPVMRPNAAGIDIGATETFVAVPADRDPEYVRSFPTFTQDLYALADWLEQCGIETVAMESTGVYWIPLFQILEERGFAVYLVNARHVKNVPGRRTDVSDCQWLQFLHSVGILKASYRPAQEVCAVRSLLRHRESLVQMAATHVHHMQKALDQMNLQLHHVISDITGLTGMAIIDAILADERDPQVLAQLRHTRIKASAEVIAKSLVGDYRPEHIFTLRQSVNAYRSYQVMIADCDREIHQWLKDFEAASKSPTPDDQGEASNHPASVSETAVKTAPSKQSDQGLGAQLKRVFGVDLTKVPGIHVGIAQTLFGEIGPDFNKFKSASAFASWMALCPDNEISGGKVLWTGTRKVKSRAAKALRLAAQSLAHSKSALGDFYRRMRAKLGAPKAITAAAHKLARIIYHLITTRQRFDESRFAAAQVRYQKRLVTKLHAKARALGFQLVPLDQAEVVS
ncbi:MAG TPA: IS110 family transposase [Pyrinomonadaceae bacterium]|nr:IS110 family transposase [Pyrinomonadaceae bacterium]